MPEALVTSTSPQLLAAPLGVLASACGDDDSDDQPLPAPGPNEVSELTTSIASLDVASTDSA